MKITTTWQGKMKFEAGANGLAVSMDAPAPIGDSSALSPKQLLLAAVCGCTGIDVAARMRKLRQGISALSISADAPKREGTPSTFDSVTLDFHFEGEVSEEAAVEAVERSQSEECGVSAMVAAHCPIHWHVHVNGKLVRSGTARFVR